MTPEIPVWLKPGLEALYLDLDEGGQWIHVKSRDSTLTLSIKVIDDKDFKELFPDEEEPDWEETPLTEWQASNYGEFFIDVARDPRTHIIYNELAEYLGMESANYESESYACFKLRILDEVDCMCKSKKKRLILFKRYGRCLTCRGILSSLVKCPACGGTGVCSFCHGKGTKTTEDIYWYEKRTGILIKYELLVEGKLVDRERLIRLEPNVFDSGD